jgi:hypothetical protein
MAKPNEQKWIISNTKGQHPGKAVGDDLDGYTIKETAHHFELHGKLASVPKNNSKDGLPVTFRNVTIHGHSWDIQVDKLPSTDAGTWTTPPSTLAQGPGNTPPTSGEFTAQTDGGDVGEEAAASAGHGKA